MAVPVVTLVVLPQGPVGRVVGQGRPSVGRLHDQLVVRGPVPHVRTVATLLEG